MQEPGLPGSASLPPLSCPRSPPFCPPSRAIDDPLVVPFQSPFWHVQHGQGTGSPARGHMVADGEPLWDPQALGEEPQTGQLLWTVHLWAHPPDSEMQMRAYTLPSTVQHTLFSLCCPAVPLCFSLKPPKSQCPYLFCNLLCHAPAPKMALLQHTPRLTLFYPDLLTEISFLSF